MRQNRKWLDLQRKHRRNNPNCAICGTNQNIEIHHILPFKENPELELDENNLISLCGKYNNCHLIHGHLGNYNNYNRNLLQLIENLKKK
jgi:5-methylcytosine-specific restriction endonuclease McrA